MNTKTQRFTVKTEHREEFLDITHLVRKAIDASEIRDGICTVFIPHTTAAVTINENADPDVQRDLTAAFDRAVPNEGFHHCEGNSDAHTKTAMTGSSATIIVENGAPLLGTWQDVYFCEFDGPRTRQVWIKVMG